LDQLGQIMFADCISERGLGSENNRLRTRGRLQTKRLEQTGEDLEQATMTPPGQGAI
jgi:hypothetical protein